MMMKEETNVASYKALCNMLKNNRDLASGEEESISRTPFNDNVRGSSAYTSISLPGKRPTMNELVLVVERLKALKLSGMAEAVSDIIKLPV